MSKPPSPCSADSPPDPGCPGDLTGAHLTGASLDGADLTTAKNLTQQQLDSAHGDEDTKLPAELQRPAHWSAGPAPPSADQ